MLLIQKISETKLGLLYLYYYTRYNDNAIEQNKKIENKSNKSHNSENNR